MEQQENVMLERMLDRYAVAPASPALMQRIVAQAMATPQPARIWPNRTAAAMLAATALFGFWLGSATAIEQASRTDAHHLWQPQAAQEILL